MTREEMYEILKRLKETTNWNVREAVKAYNETARMLRKMVEESEDK